MYYFYTFASPIEKAGTLAQLVEQRTENPCVTGSIPVGTTNKIKPFQKCKGFFISNTQFCAGHCMLFAEREANGANFKKKN